MPGKNPSEGDEVWYHGYHAKWTQREGTGRATMSWLTRPKDPGQEAHYQGSLKDNQ
jgi:hypothetical protein